MRPQIQFANMPSAPSEPSCTYPDGTHGSQARRTGALIDEGGPGGMSRGKGRSETMEPRFVWETAACETMKMVSSDL